MKHLRSLIPLALILLLTSVVVADTMFLLPSPSGGRSDTYSFGEVFTVGSQDLIVTHLGAFDLDLDGFLSSNGIPVGVYRESDAALLRDTLVLSSDPAIGYYRYAPITPVILLAGEQYRLAAVNGEDFYNVSTTFSVTPAVTYDFTGWGQSSSLLFSNVNTGNTRVWMANMSFTARAATAVPTPTALAAMLAMGVLALGAAALRRRKPA